MYANRPRTIVEIWQVLEHRIRHRYVFRTLVCPSTTELKRVTRLALDSLTIHKVANDTPGWKIIRSILAELSEYLITTEGKRQGIL